MTDKEIRRLRKTELLWMIHDQEEEIRELKEKIAKLEERTGGELGKNFILDDSEAEG